MKVQAGHDHVVTSDVGVTDAAVLLGCDGEDDPKLEPTLEPTRDRKDDKDNTDEEDDEGDEEDDDAGNDEAVGASWYPIIPYSDDEDAPAAACRLEV